MIRKIIMAMVALACASPGFAQDEDGVIYDLKPGAPTLARQVGRLAQRAQEITLFSFANIEARYLFDERELDRDIRYIGTKKFRCQPVCDGREAVSIALSRAKPIEGKCRAALSGKVVFGVDRRHAFYILGGGVCIYYRGRYYVAHSNEDVAVFNLHDEVSGTAGPRAPHASRQTPALPG